jgi:hypothetical protein
MSKRRRPVGLPPQIVFSSPCYNPEIRFRSKQVASACLCLEHWLSRVRGKGRERETTDEPGDRAR